MSVVEPAARRWAMRGRRSQQGEVPDDLLPERVLAGLLAVAVQKSPVSTTASFFGGMTNHHV
jgi:hypothetical protein